MEHTAKKDLSATKEKNTRQRKWMVDIRNDLALYLMLIPFVIHYIIFYFKPMSGLLMAFQDFNVYKGMLGSPWVGLDNFRSFIEGAYFLRTFKNTMVMGIYSLVFSFPAPIILAMLLNEMKNGLYKSAVQTATFLPYFISIVVICGITVNMLSPNGIINHIIVKLGGERTYFMMKSEWFRPIYILVNLWHNSGYSALVYIAALSGIDPCLYEACVIDGGGKFKQIWHITIPGILPTIVTMLIMKVGHIFSVGYETIILLYQPVTYETADVMSTYMYRVGLTDGKYGLATAVSLFNSLISLIFVYATNLISKRLTETSLW